MWKRGGVRALCCFFVRADLVSMPDVCGKNEKPDLTAADRQELRAIVSAFKALKQGLKVKTFACTSQNAVQIQIWTALIAMLVLRYLQMKSTSDWSLSNLVALLRQQLSVYRDLWTWLDNPFQPPPPLVAAEQLSLRVQRG
jgi:hypothetical protein